MPDNYLTIERRLRAELKEYIRSEFAERLKFHAYSANSADGTNDKIQGYQTEGSDEQQYDFDGRRVFPFGLRSRPPSGTFGVWIGLGGESGNGVIVAAESSRFGPSNLDDGEVALYNKVNGTLIKLDKNGAATMTDQGGAQVKLDGSGNITVQAAAPSGSVTVSATAVTGSVKLGPVATLAVLVQGAFDSMGVPVSQAPAALLTIVKAG